MLAGVLDLNRPAVWPWKPRVRAPSRGLATGDSLLARIGVISEKLPATKPLTEP